MVSKLTTMISFLLLASGVNAVDFISKNNLIAEVPHNFIAERFMAAKQRISSQLQKNSLHYAHRYARHLESSNAAATQSDKPCMWNPSESTCELSMSFLGKAADHTTHPSAKAMITNVHKCGMVAKDDKQTCLSHQDCQFKSSKCEMSEAAQQKILTDMMNNGPSDCSAVMSMMINDCSAATNPASCSDKCEWKEDSKHDFDSTDQCVQVGECKTKTKPDDPFGIAGMCGGGFNMTVTMQECGVLQDEGEKLDCMGNKCPILIMFFGAFGCMSQPTATKCEEGALSKLCTWNNKCELDTEYAMDLIIPKDCWMRDMIKDGMFCEGKKNKDECDKNSGKCAWKMEKTCEAAGPPKEKYSCQASQNDMMRAMVGDYAFDQVQQCDAAKTKSACEDVAEVPAPLHITSFATTASVAAGVITTVLMNL